MTVKPEAGKRYVLADGKIIPGYYSGVDVRLDGEDLVIEVPQFYADTKNITDTIKVLETLKNYLEGKK